MYRHRTTATAAAPHAGNSGQAPTPTLPSIRHRDSIVTASFPVMTKGNVAVTMRRRCCIGRPCSLAALDVGESVGSFATECEGSGRQRKDGGASRKTLGTFAP